MGNLENWQLSCWSSNSNNNKELLLQTVLYFQEGLLLKTGFLLYFFFFVICPRCHAPIWLSVASPLVSVVRMGFGERYSSKQLKVQRAVHGLPDPTLIIPQQSAKTCTAQLGLRGWGWGKLWNRERERGKIYIYQREDRGRLGSECKQRDIDHKKKETKNKPPDPSCGTLHSGQVNPASLFTASLESRVQRR